MPRLSTDCALYAFTTIKKKNQPKYLNTLLCFIQLLCLYAFYKMPIRTMPIRLEPINHLTPIVTNLLLLQTHVGSLEDLDIQPV